MPKDGAVQMSYTVVFTDFAKASVSLSAVEAKARDEIAKVLFGISETLPRWGFHTFEMPDGREFIAWLHGEQGEVEIDLVAGHDSLGCIEDKAEWLGLTGEITVPVPYTTK